MSFILPSGQTFATKADAYHSGVDIRELREVADHTTHAAERTSGTGEVAPELVAAVARENETLVRMGLLPATTIRPEGSTLWGSGLDAWNVKRAALEGSPTVAKQAASVRATVAAERRTPVETAISDIRFDVDASGKLTARRHSKGASAAGIAIERNGLRNLTTRYGGILPGWSFVQTMEAGEIADLWNSRAERIAAREGHGSAMVWVRAQPDGGVPGIFAFTGPRYAAYSAGEVAGDLAAIHGDYHGDIVYDRNNVSLTWEIASMRDLPPVVGEVYQARVTGGTSDDGSSSVYWGGGFDRALCSNLTTQILAIGDSYKQHRGAVTAVSYEVRSGLQANAIAILEAFPGFAREVTACAQTRVTVLGVATLSDAIEKIVDGRASLREASGVKRDALVESLLRNVKADGGDPGSVGSLNDIVKAVTRWHEVSSNAVRVGAMQSQGAMMQREWSDEYAAA